MAQRVYLQKGAVGALGDVLRELAPRRVLLVCDRASFALSGAEAATREALAPYRVARFDDFGLNPKLPDVERGLALARSRGFDLVLAVGGGSALDTAKLIRILAAQEAAPADIAQGRAPIAPPGVPLIAVPTTAGTGSEATRFAVVYVQGIKFSVEHEYILPDVAIVDPTLTYSMPPRVTAATGMDALCQAVESYWSVNSTEDSRADAREAIALATAHLPRAVHAGDPEARAAMSRAAHLAGRAINVSKTTAPHALSYTITSRFGVPHGHAVSLTLGEFLVYNSQVTAEDAVDPRGAEYVRRTLAEVSALLGGTRAEGARERLGELMERIGLETRLGAVGIRTPADRELLADSVNPQRLANNPRRVTREALLTLLERIA